MTGNSDTTRFEASAAALSVFALGDENPLAMAEFASEIRLLKYAWQSLGALAGSIPLTKALMEFSIAAPVDASYAPTIVTADPFGTGAYVYVEAVKPDRMIGSPEPSGLGTTTIVPMTCTSAVDGGGPRSS